MALPTQIGDREHDKFIETPDGKTAIRIGPNAIQDTKGQELALNSFGQASVRDESVFTELKNIHEVLEQIRFQLEILTGAHING